MPHFIIGIEQLEPMAIGWVANVARMDIAIVCRRDIGGDWEPLYAVKNGEGRIALPHCFTLDPAYLDMLETAWIAEMEDAARLDREGENN